MKKEFIAPYIISSIAELHRLLCLPKPEHPLVSVVKLEDITCLSEEIITSFSYNFYSICIKKDFDGKMKYGQNYYDFDEGTMTFSSPGQVISTEVTANNILKGWWLVIHADFFQNYSLAKTIKDYGYFSYAANEALHLSEKEEAVIIAALLGIRHEFTSPIDNYSQDVIISQIELLLTYCNRYYNRQFITRKHANSDLLSKLETVLIHYLNSEVVQKQGLPTVQYLAKQLNVSANYLSDMLRSQTGQNTQQHIHNKLIEKAKEILTTTSLSVNEIAYRLGFEYPQSFSKLFKNKTQISPLEFRNQFN